MADSTVNLSKADPDNIFVVENVLSAEPTAALEEHGIYFLVKENKKGRTAYHLSKDTKKTISTILTQKAREAIESNQVELSQNLLNSSLKYDDTNIAAMNLYGKLLWRCDLIQDSLHLYGRCLSIDPTNLEALLSRAMILSKKNQKLYYDAEWHFKLACKFHPNHVLVLSSYAGFLAEVRKDRTQADKYYSKALELMKKQALAKVIHSIRDESSVKSPKSPKYEEDTKTDPNSRKRSKTAKKKLESTELLQVSNPEVYYNYALFCAEQLRDMKKAREHIEKYLEHFPRDQDGLLLLQEVNRIVRKY